ncbi:MAG: tetratricopeptide repeat protein [Candidatus Aureabacteria bacterium]|nr:tetratricopeptide repeat protein [Candidatus Auribacterota bacterium]
MLKKTFVVILLSSLILTVNSQVEVVVTELTAWITANKVIHSVKNSKYIQALYHFEDLDGYAQLDDEQKGELFLRRAQLYYGDRMYEKAVSDYQNALSLKKDHREINLNIGNAYFKLKNYEMAHQFYSNEILYNPDCYQAYENRAVTARKLKLPEAEAAKDLEECARVKKIIWEKKQSRAQNADKTWQDHFDLGYANFENKKYEDALSCFNQASSMKKDAPWVYYWCAKTKCYLKQYKEALQDADLSISIDASQKDFYKLRGQIRQKLKDHSGAKEDFKKAKEIK